MALPSRLGEFELNDLLGEGGTGEVYGARKDGAPVALKVLRADLALTERERRRFLDEAAKMRRVTHASIVPVLEAGTLPDGRPYLSMPHLKGETLAAKIARGPLPSADALRIFAELADAVSTLHAAGLVHRDIKPENVLVLSGESGRAVLLDLGIAREVDAKSGTTTEEGKMRGTPAYMAPERFFGSPATVQTDVYELAVVLYAMLTGRLPWDEEAGPAGRLHPRHPDEAGGNVPAPVATALLRALSTRPEMRPASAATFAEDVRRGFEAPLAGAARTTARVDVEGRISRNAPTPGPTTTNKADDARPTAPRSRRLGIAVGLVVLLTGGAVASGLSWFRASQPPSAPAGNATPITPETSAAPVSVTKPPMGEVPSPATMTSPTSSTASSAASIGSALPTAGIGRSGRALAPTRWPEAGSGEAGMGRTLPSRPQPKSSSEEEFYLDRR